MNWISVDTDLPDDAQVVEVLCWGAYSQDCDPLRMIGCLTVSNGSFLNREGWKVPYLSDWRSVEYWRPIEEEYPNHEVRERFEGKA